MLKDETRRKFRLLNVGEFIEELEMQQQDLQTLAHPFDDRFQLLTDSVYQRKYNEAESIVERFAHNTTWVETGDVNMRQYLSHA